MRPLSSLQVVPRLALRAARAASRPLPSDWAVSFDVQLAPGSVIAVVPGSGQLEIRRAARRSEQLLVGPRAEAIQPAPGWPVGPSHHIELTPGRTWVDGRPIAASPRHGTSLLLRAVRGRALISALIVSSVRDRAALLFQRLAELHARLGSGQYPVGADAGDRLHIDSRYWTSGFWPGALWRAAALRPAGGMFRRWATSATIAHLGRERTDTHDVGFMYGQSSLAAWQALCRVDQAPSRLCHRLRASVVGAADELLALAASNRRAGTIPTNSRGSHADTIVDSMMNIALLPWASAMTGNPVYRRLAAAHAARVAALLVRGDGSTVQAVNFDRASGKVVSIATHQGLSASSTWSRGEGWALYGFAQAAGDLRNRGLLRVAARIAGYVARKLSDGRVPSWDYAARQGDPVDVSAGVITAAGLLRLVGACGQMPGVCDATGTWSALAGRLVTASLRHASPGPPLGLLDDQVLDERARGCWCNGGELIFGLSYGLEALQLERAVS